MEQPDDVLVPLVNVPHQGAAIEHAVTAASGGSVTVLNVVTPIDEPFSEGRVLSVTEERRADARERARELVEDATENSGSAVEIDVAEGRPARTAANRARERGVDRIVIGGRDRSGLRSLLFGRSAAAVLDDVTDVPITVVGAPPERGGRGEESS